MADKQKIPAAQYLRMSTERQQYSLENQSIAIQCYADEKGFEVVRTYSDSAKSGLVLRYRAGLRELLQDAISRSAPFRAILVYDISRWGRFQDSDESAHYEFVCKSAGAPVHYCAESFANDGTLPSMIMKALKRTMAGEYSRELGVKVLAGQKRLARLGFKQGGKPGYGLRRMLVSIDGVRKQQLADGERKSIATDRVILVPGPIEEVQVVRRIYSMLISGVSIHAISHRLNRAGLKYQGEMRWTHHTVAEVLTNPKYAGIHVFGRTSSRLSTPSVGVAKSNWILAPHAFEPIVDYPNFAQAQDILQNRTGNKTDEELLQTLRALLAREGRLSLRIIKNSPEVPSPSTYRKRFGSLRRTYELIGYDRPEGFAPIDLRRRTDALRSELFAMLASLFPRQIAIESRGGRWRKRLRMRSGFLVSILLVRAIRVWNDQFRWVLDPAKHERRCITLIARLNTQNGGFMDFYMFPTIDRTTRTLLKQNDSWLKRGQRLDDLSQFCAVVDAMKRIRGSNKT